MPISIDLRSALRRAHSFRTGGTPLLALAALVTLTSTIGVAGALKAVPDPLSDSALTAALRTGSDEAKRRQLASANLELQTKAVQFPNQLSKARVVLGRGYTPTDLQKMVGVGGLEVTQVEAKIAVPNSTEVYTVILMGAALEETQGNIGARSAGALAKAQNEFRKLAVADPASQAKYSAIARNPLLVYAFDSIGTNATLATLGDSPDVRLVQPSLIENAAIELDGQRKLRQLMKERAPTKAGAISGTLAPAQCSQNRVTPGQQLGAGTASPVCPVEIPEDPITPPTTPLPTPTNEPFVDSGVTDANDIVDGYKDPNAALVAANAVFLNCNSSVAGQHCPNDFTYTTQAKTGGTFTWSAGVTRTGGPVATIYCGLVWYPGYYDYYHGSFGWSCYRATSNRPKFTNAVAVSKFSFGSVTVSIPTSPGAAGTTTKMASTYAWSGLPQAADGSSAICSPTSGILSVERPCNASDINGSYIDGVSGFEDKIRIPNPSCTLASRSGTSSDKTSGCLSPDRLITNLPSSYLDTTFGDGPAASANNRNDFTASVGVADGKLLVTGFKYESRIDGSMNGWESVKGLAGRHLQAATARDQASTACITGLFIMTPFSSAACMYNVDITIVGPDALFR